MFKCFCEIFQFVVGGLELRAYVVQFFSCAFEDLACHVAADDRLMGLQVLGLVHCVAGGLAYVPHATIGELVGRDLKLVLAEHALQGDRDDHDRGTEPTPRKELHEQAKHPLGLVLLAYFRPGPRFIGVSMLCWKPDFADPLGLLLWAYVCPGPRFCSRFSELGQEMVQQESLRRAKPLIQLA